MSTRNRDQPAVVFDDWKVPGRSKAPYIAAWVQNGTIEIGYNDYDDVFLRVTDAGGVVWETNKTYSHLDDAFSEMNAAIEAWCTENGIDLQL